MELTECALNSNTIIAAWTMHFHINIYTFNLSAILKIPYISLHKFPSTLLNSLDPTLGKLCLGTANEFSESSDILVSSPSHNPSNKRCTFRKCRFRWCRHLKQFPHTLQGNLRALICDALSAWTLSLWRLRWCFHLKTLPHSVHMNGCSSECVR